MVVEKVIGFILGVAILSAICYRLGGSAKKGNWLDFARNGKVRDVGCSLLFLGLWWALFGFKLAFWKGYLLSFGLSWGALSTYWDWLFGYDNHYAHGLGCGLAAIPLCIWSGGSWWIIIIRLIICTIGMGLWSKRISNDVWEERGRGFLYII